MSSYQVMGDFLQRHAYTNVWCSPAQDKQARFELARISPLNGYWIKFRHLWRLIHLPEKTGRYHVFHIGQIHSSILGLFTNDRGAWVSAAYAMNKENLYLDIYNDRGIQVPRCLVSFIVTQDNNLLVAIRVSDQTPDNLDIDLENEPVYVRMYSNAFFESARRDQSVDLITCYSQRVLSVGAITQLQDKVAQLPGNPEQRIYFVNGIKVDSIDLVTVTVGDYVDVIYDGSIKRTVSFKVRDLQEFNSTADNLRKYLLHYAGDVDTIEYKDDVDVYLSAPQPNGRNKGVFLHKNDDRTLRMVTHRDYSIPVIRIGGASAANAFLDNNINRTLKLYIRHSGYHRPLVYDNNRIMELYKLPDERVVRAMLGIDSTVSVWTADALESSGYVRLMDRKAGEITRNGVQEGYGYNAISLLVGNTPKVPRLESGMKVVDIPEGLRGCATVYEYDGEGRLLGYSHSTLDDTHSCQYAQTELVEVLFGLGGTSLEMHHNVQHAAVNPTCNYRFYKVAQIGGVATGDWVDVTGTSEYFGQSDQFQWISMTGKHTRVLSNRKHLAYNLNVRRSAGVLTFNILHDSIYAGQLQQLEFPLGELDIFLNGYSLIEGLDYYTEGNKVTIVCKKHINFEDEVQVVTIRYTGFCNPDMTRTLPSEKGFVYHGVLSHNNRFDLRDDRVMRVICGGRLYHKNEVLFAEDGVEARIVDATNGEPYQLRDIVVPMNNYLVADGGLDDSTYALREKAAAINKEVSDYLTLMLPEQSVEEPNAITARYQLYSPFFARIIDDLQTGVLWSDRFYEHFGDEFVREIAAPYLPLLKVDPIGGDNGVDSRYVVVHPHNYDEIITLDIYKYRVLTRIAQVYANGLIDLSSMIRVLQF